MAVVRRTPGGAIRKVKNLGWLLRNYGEVASLEVVNGSDGNEAMLIAHLRDGGYYVTDYASRAVLSRWLNRSIFHGLTLHWYGAEVVIGDHHRYFEVLGADMAKVIGRV